VDGVLVENQNRSAGAVARFDAVAEFEQAAAGSTTLLGRNHPETIAIFDDLGNVHRPDRFALTSAIPA
jgi:hypothetical protein